MGITERREREKNERRRAILNCARELILEHGVERVNMEEVARKAELSKATVYLYFPGKDVILQEIREEAAKDFLDHIKPFAETGLTGIKALKYFWRGYVELFGNSDEMIIVFKLHNFFNPGNPFVSMEGQSKSQYDDAIIAIIKTVIDQCKAEGTFDSNLDSNMATQLLLSIFSNAVDKAAGMTAEARRSPAFLDEMIKAFQIIIYGFAREAIDRSDLDIVNIH
ncbi:MAG: TetR/AcrR family transcriptional regulator [Treponema sp.]|nr:TetR/AcrR family transcriptional regulator [Treponema sp.]